MQVWSLAQEGPLEEGMATYSSILAFLPMDRGAWQATVYRVTKIWIDWNDLVKWKWKSFSPVRTSVVPWTTQTMGFSKPDTGVGSLSFLQGTFPTQGLNPGLLHCRRIPHPAEPDDLTHTQINLMCMCVHKNKDYKEILQNINSGSNDLL